MNDTRADRLLVLATSLARSAEEERWIRTHLPCIRDWDGLLQLAHDNRVLPMLRWQLEQLGCLDVLPPDTRARLDAAQREVAEANEARLATSARILAALRGAHVEVVLLKGVMLGEVLYGNPGYKRMNDIDLLIRRSDLATVYRVYQELGLFHLAERVGGNVERQAEVSHHAPPFIDRALTCMVGTQWAFKSPMLGLRFDYDAIWERTVPMELRGVSLRRLSFEDQLHHLCVHLDRFKTGVRDLMDVYNLAHVHASDLDWELLYSEILRAGSAPYVYYTLSLAHRLRPHFEVADLLDRLAPHVPAGVARRTRRRSRSLAVSLRNSSRQLSNIEKAVSLFNATKAPSEKAPLFLAGWRSIFLPPLREALRICAIPEDTPRARLQARLMAPLELTRAISDEIGGLLLLLLLLKSALDLARSLLPGERPDLRAYAERVGVPLEELLAARDAFE